MTEKSIASSEFNPSISLQAPPGIEPDGSAAEGSATLRTLTVRDREMFAKLRIPESLLADAGVCRVTDREARERWGFDKSSVTADMSGIVFPYFAPEDGHRVSARIRRDNPEIGADGKPQAKYMTAWGDRRRLYYPPIAKEKLADPSVPILLVEAEKSALALTAWSQRLQRPMLVLAMGGCFGWSMTSRKRNEFDVEVDQKGSLWDLCYVEGHEVFVLLDANVATNNKVEMAERRLKKMLRIKKAARTHLCRLPLMDGVNGPDDYIAQCRDEAMLEVLDGKFGGRDPDDDRERIELSGNNRELADVAEEMGAVLRGTLFTHGDDIVIPRGASLHVVKPQQLRTLIAPHIACTRKTKDGVFVVTMSEVEAAGILVAPQFRQMLYPIQRVNRCRLPALRENGQIDLLPEGYDEATATLTVSDVKYRTDMQHGDAVKLLHDLYSEFEFVDNERSLAVTIAGAMTLFCPHLLPEGALRPGFVVTKNAEGAGASTLIRCMNAPVLGEVPFNARPGNDDEMRKLITSIVRGGGPSLVLDNVSGVLKSCALEMFLTSYIWRDRQLGGNEMISGLNLATVFITGNGLTLSPDMNRRTLVTELHQSFERPGDRRFTRSLDVAALRQLRPELLAAYWALVRFWAETGRPPASMSDSAFPQWSHTVGGIVEAAGFACPLLPSASENTAAVDEDGEDMRQLVAAMTPGHEYTFANLVAECRNLEVFPSLTGDPQNLMTPAQLSKLGKTFSRYDNRRVGRRMFMISGYRHSRKSRRYIARLAPGETVSDRSTALSRATGETVPDRSTVSSYQESVSCGGNGQDGLETTVP